MADPVARRRQPVIREREVSLLELLDRILDKGVVIAGDVVISVADIDLVYLGIKLILTSVETMEKQQARYALGATTVAAPQARTVEPAQTGAAPAGQEERGRS